VNKFDPLRSTDSFVVEADTDISDVKSSIPLASILAPQSSNCFTALVSPLYQRTFTCTLASGTNGKTEAVKLLLDKGAMHAMDIGGKTNTLAYIITSRNF
jgi:hypothetical protein